MKNTMKNDSSEVEQQRLTSTRVLGLWARTVPVLALCAWLGWAPRASALGFRIPNQDASAIARGNAFVATADNPSAIYYNPAGITQLEGNNVQMGSLFYLGIYGDAENANGTTVHNNAEVIPVPTLQYTITPEGSPLSFGLGLYEPFGFSVDWPNEAPFRQEGTKANLSYFTINPVVAWKVLPSLSIAVGPTFNYSQVDIQQGLFPVPYILPGDQAEYQGNNWGYGFNAGVLWQPLPKWSFGGSYRSTSRMNYKGDFTLSTPPLAPTTLNTATTIDFPQIAIAGVSFRPTPKWNIEFDVDWADWSSVRALMIQHVQSRQLNWRASWMFELGATYYFDNHYYLSAGYFFSQASTPTEFFTPLVPDSDLHIGSVGGGHKGEHWSWAVAFQLIAGGWRDVAVSPTINQTVNGRYRLFTPTLSFTVGYRF